MSNPMTDVAEIARGLTKAQRDAFEAICRENVALRVAIRAALAQSLPQ